MKYSFVIIAYNEAEHIATTIASIKALDKLGDNYEIIVVDDGSRDRTSPIVHELMQADKRISIIGDGQNHGRGHGRYVGAEESTGDYVIMIDADIRLPKTWLATCLENLNNHDIVGGIAVPDGDVGYIYRHFRLKPKTIMGSTTITGNNGCYKRNVFSKLTFDKNLHNGEDVDFNKRAIAAGISEYCIPGLTVEHQENKPLWRSLSWLAESGVGATRQLIRFKEIRMPDIAFFLTLMAFVVALLFKYWDGGWLWSLAPLGMLLGASFMHLRSKFYLAGNRPFAALFAYFTDVLHIFCYYVGRLAGFFVLAWEALR